MKKINSQRHFASDNYAPIHPEVLEALKAFNSGHQPAYGDDEVTQLAKVEFQKHFGDVEVEFVFNGTGANVLALRSLLQPQETVICSQHAHIHEDEGGAPEWNLGCKLVPIPTGTGKIHAQQIEEALFQQPDNIHRVQSKVISITQSTEYGTVYSSKELAEINKLCKRKALYLHIDGARIANAAVSLGKPLKEIVKGCDVLSFGGTKNGLMMGEALVFFNKSLHKNFQFYRKQNMQLASKMRFISAQFYALLKNDLWKKNASHSNKMARVLEKELKNLDFEITQKVQANAVFVRLPLRLANKVRKKFLFYDWQGPFKDKTVEARLMCSFDTTEEDITSFIQLFKA